MENNKRVNLQERLVIYNFREHVFIGQKSFQ